MKTIKIFLASSEELKDERLEMTDLVSRLNQTFMGRGIQLELKRWEYLDSSMGDQRKQDEYNNVLRECDICLVLFWRKFGSYTGEELDVAYQCYKNKHKPEKIYVFFKNPDDDDVTTELKEFTKSYESRYGGHFFNKFLTVDTLKLEFLLQFELYQKDQLGEKAIEVRNEHVYVDNEMVADLNNIPFAANNEGFKKKQAELKELREIIAELQASLAKKQRKLERKKADYEENPEDEDCLEDYQDAKEDVDKLTDELQKKLDRKNALEKEFEREQQNLFNTARRITEQRGQKISERMARAIEAFESGDAQRADIILDEAERDFEEARKDFRITKKVSVQALEEQIQRASYKMSNDSIPIEERVAKALEIYEEADAFAQEINYDQEKYIEFLFKYSNFLDNFDHNSMEVNNRLMKLCYELYGKNHPCTARSYDKIGYEYIKQRNYVKALLYFKEALTIRNNILEKDHPDIAISYHYIGLTYHMYKDYDKALEFYKQALDIRERVLGKEHPDTATSYEEIGDIYDDQHNYEKALEYYNSALVIREKALGREHPKTALTLLRISGIYNILDNSKRSMEFMKKSIPIITKHYTKDYPSGPAVLHVLAYLNSSIMNHEKTIDLLLMAAEKGDKHNSNVLAQAYIKMDKYEEALKWAEKAKAEGDCDTDTLSTIYLHLNRYGDALKQFELSLREKKKQQKYYIKKRLNTDELDKEIHETEKKIAALKELMKNGGVSEQ